MWIQNKAVGKVAAIKKTKKPFQLSLICFLVSLNIQAAQHALNLQHVKYCKLSQ